MQTERRCSIAPGNNYILKNLIGVKWTQIICTANANLHKNAPSLWQFIKWSWTSTTCLSQGKTCLNGLSVTDFGVLRCLKKLWSIRYLHWLWQICVRHTADPKNILVVLNAPWLPRISYDVLWSTKTRYRLRFWCNSKRKVHNTQNVWCMEQCHSTFLFWVQISSASVTVESEIFRYKYLH